MIPIESLKKGPHAHVPRTGKEDLPLVDAGKIIDKTEAKIEAVRKRAESAFRFRPGRTSYRLLDVSAGQRLVDLTDVTSPDRVIGRAEPAMMQELIFEVMQANGLDKNIRVSDPNNPTRIFGDGTTKEYLIFPSLQFPGLVFEQTTTSGTDGYKGFAWHVSDAFAPDVRVGPIERYKPGVRKALKDIAVLTRK